MRLLPILALLASSVTHGEEPLTVAAASSFSPVLGEIASRFHESTGIAIRTSSGSTGKLYAQIINGAPFDVFLAADSKRPALLESNGLAAEGTRFTYAVGTLVLWSRYEEDCEAALQKDGWIAIANPDVAPYGEAAREYLENAGIWEAARQRIAYAENVQGAYHFAMTGNARVGIVAPALLDGPHAVAGSCVAAVPAHFYTPIQQQAVLLQRAADDDRARMFLDFLRSDAAMEVIRNRGYGVAR